MMCTSLLCIIVFLSATSSLYADFPAEEVWSVELDTTVTCLGPNWAEDGQVFFLVGGVGKIWILSEDRIVTTIEEIDGAVNTINRIDFRDGDGYQIVAGTNTGRIIVFSSEDLNITFNEQLLDGYDHPGGDEGGWLNERYISDVDFFPSWRQNEDRNILMSNRYDSNSWGDRWSSSSSGGNCRQYSFNQNELGGNITGGFGTELFVSEDEDQTVLISGTAQSSFYETSRGDSYFRFSSSCGLTKINDRLDITELVLAEYEREALMANDDEEVSFYSWTLINDCNEPSIVASYHDMQHFKLALVNLESFEIENEMELQSPIYKMQFYTANEENRDSFIISLFPNPGHNGGNCLGLINPRNLRITDVYPIQGMAITDYRIGQFDNDTELEMLSLERDNNRFFVILYNIAPLSVSYYGDVTPDKFSITAAFPNPFNTEAIIEYNLIHPGNYTITVHDLIGQEITRLVQGWHNIGTYRTVWDARGVGSGAYLIRLDGGMRRSVKRVSLVR